ncbi:MAG: DUF4238 domain-containing protein [Bacteroidetes bacterium]|nr:DUF4238 domain-containing protein [Bacteroidota bacterium]
MSLPKRHHIVPQFILKRFTNQNQKLWCFRKERSHCFLASTQNVFVENNFYSIIQRDGSRDTSMEGRLADIEYKADKILCKIIENSRMRPSLQISHIEHTILTRFLFIQSFRSQSYRESAYNPELFDISVEINEKLGYFLSEQDRKIWEDEEIRSRMSQSIFLRSLDKLLSDGFWESKFVREIMQKNIGLMRIIDDRESFIIGDYPIVSMSNQEEFSKYDQPDEVYLPISHDIIIYWRRKNDILECRSITDNQFIKRINEIILSQSRTVAGRSRDLITSLSTSMAAFDDPARLKPFDREAIVTKLTSGDSDPSLISIE